MTIASASASELAGSLIHSSINSSLILSFSLSVISLTQVSQPRRIAASSLMRRLRPSLGFKVGLRLGQGVRDERTETVLHFVTCGYLVRLMAHHPNHFKYHTHLIIDEVHERSIDADLLCMFTRQLLDRFPSIRLVLMSATLHTDLYKDYFSKFTYPLEPLFVGVKRFGIEYKYMKDVIEMAKKNKVPNNLLNSFEILNKSTARCRGAQTVSICHESSSYISSIRKSRDFESSFFLSNKTSFLYYRNSARK